MMNFDKQKYVSTPPNPTSSSSSSSSSSSVKSRFTIRFARSLMRISRQLQQENHHPKDGIIKRCRRVKIAADKSLALAVGSRRVWSRALLSKIRRRRGQRRSIHHHKHHTRFLYRKKTKGSKENNSDSVRVDSDQLRKVVPGGEGMDIINLLDETAHYIQCLVTQVQVMKNIDSFYSDN